MRSTSEIGGGGGGGVGVGEGVGDGDGEGEGLGDGVGDGSGGVVPVEGVVGVGPVDVRLLQAPPMTKTARAAAVTDNLESIPDGEANALPLPYY